jgi:hypothetical protein
MMHPLRAWREANKLDMRAFGKQVGISGASICRIEAGYQWTSNSIAQRISSATDGAVSIKCLQNYRYESRIYFVQCEPCGPIKIGVVFSNLRQGMTEIQINCPYQLRLLGTTPGDKIEETRLKKLFARWNMRAEWFEPHPDCLAIINGLIGQSRLLEAA